MGWKTTLGCLVAFLALAIVPAESEAPGAAHVARPASATTNPADLGEWESAPGDRPRGALELAPLGRWETFGVRDGLPSEKAFAVRLDGKRVWVGTDNGLAVFEGGRWRSYGVEDGLPHRVILSLDVSPRTGDLWIGTMGGMARFSAGRFDVFDQINSGLSNDFVNSVRCDPEEDQVWAATAMGVSRLDLKSRSWSTFDHRNTPMHEPWTYSVTMGDGAVYVGAWGAGVLEYTKTTGRWREYRDPDKEFEIDLFPDDGPVSDITSSVDFGAGRLWQATYTGATRYDGREWRSHFAEDSGLAGNFVNFVRAQGPYAWFATDQGLSFTDGEDWVTYQRQKDDRTEIRFYEGKELVASRMIPSGLAHNYVLGIDADGDEVWVATGQGINRAIREGLPPLRREPQGSDEGYAAAPNEGVEGEARERFPYAATPEELLPYGEYLPYQEFFKERTAFRGPGREKEPGEMPEQVSIGFIGPLEDRDNPVLPPGFRSGIRYNPKAVFGRRMLRAATLALVEANERGGFRGIPFRLVPRTDLVLWGQTSNELVRFVHEDKVWAVLSSIDSNHNHVLSRTTIKTEIPIVSAGSTDPTLVEHSVPWLVRCIIDDRQEAYALLNEILRVRGLSRIALLRVNDRDGRVGVSEFVQGARRLGHPIVIEQRFDIGDTDFRDSLARIRQASPDALVLWGNPEETAGIVRQVRELGMELPLFGFDRMATHDFLEAAGEAAEGVVVVATQNPDRDDPLWREFRKRYQQRWGEDPDAFAAYAYDGMNLLIGAIREAGLNRARIRDALFEVKRYRGVTGLMIFDTNMNNVAPPWLAVVENGSFQYRAAPPWSESETGARAASNGYPGEGSEERN